MLPPPSSEQPVYVLPQRMSRAVVPKILSLVVLSALFYSGILVNLALLNLKAQQEFLIQLLSLVLLFLVVILGVYLAVHRAHFPYLFYHNRLVHNKKEIYYSSITTIIAKRDIWDKLFKTYSLGIGNTVYLRNISGEINLKDYVRQLIAYSRRG